MLLQWCNTFLSLKTLPFYNTGHMSASLIFFITGCKWTLTAGLATCVIFIAAFFYPKWEILLPAAALYGMGASAQWIAHGHYINTVSNVNFSVLLLTMF